MKPLDTMETVLATKEVAIVVERVGRKLMRLSEPADWWQFPIETVSLSEAGFERTYQGTTFLAHWPLELEPGAVWKMKAQVELI